jgi:inorganic pyrophosphatase
VRVPAGHARHCCWLDAQNAAAPLLHRTSGLYFAIIARLKHHPLMRNPMSLNNVSSGRDLPNDFNVVIEIPMNADPIKYEVDKESGAIFVDRFMGTAMHYPCNYGYVPNTLSPDGDPVDVLVITPFPLIPGVVVRCRPIGVLKMTDESGEDAKVLAVPVDKVLSIYSHWQKPEDLNELRLRQIQHFFEHYKDLEKGKWVKIDGWYGPDVAKEEILGGVAAYKADAAKAAS